MQICFNENHLFAILFDWVEFSKVCLLSESLHSKSYLNLIEVIVKQMKSAKMKVKYEIIPEK